MVIAPVECVAECLSKRESEHIKIQKCDDRNAARLLAHFSCYAECGFFLIDKYTIGPPSGGWTMGLFKMLPAFISSYFFNE